MNQQAAARQGPGAAGGGVAAGRGKPRLWFCSNGDASLKGFRLAISEIANNTFNTGHNKSTGQFSQSCKNVANYHQRTSDEGYLVA
jgi:hypothetical protein